MSFYSDPRGATSFRFLPCTQLDPHPVLGGPHRVGSRHELAMSPSRRVFADPRGDDRCGCRPACGLAFDGHSRSPMLSHDLRRNELDRQ
jgi:hypothetical protein